MGRYGELDGVCRMEGGLRWDGGTEGRRERKRAGEERRPRTSVQPLKLRK